MFEVSFVCRTNDTNGVLSNCKRKMSSLQPHVLYMLVNDCPNVTTTTHIGHTTDIFRRLLQHNGKLPGGPRVTRKAAGFWKVALTIVLPQHRDLGHAELVEFWKRNSRKANRRLEFGIEMARDLQVPWFLNSDLLGHKDITSTIPAVVRRYRRDKARLSRAEIRKRLQDRIRRYMATQPTPSNSCLVMSSGRKRDRETVKIDFRRSWSVMSSEQRMQVLRKQTTFSEAAADTQRSGGRKKKRTPAEIPLTSLMSSLWLRRSDSSTSNATS